MRRESRKAHFAVALWLAAALVRGQQPPLSPALTGDSPPNPVAAPQATPGVNFNVTCKGNTLAISARNALLGSLLAEVQKCSGARIDVPDSAKAVRVFDELGPGPAGSVLANLLAASGYDFVIGASPADPEKIEMVLLMARSGDKGTVVAEGGGNAIARRAFAQMREAARPKAPEEQAEALQVMEETPSPNSTAKPDEQSQKPETANSEEANASATENKQAASDTEPKPAAAAPERPARSGLLEDRIGNMQQLFEQRRQMMKAQPASQPPPQ